VFESSGTFFLALLKCLAPFGIMVKFGRGVLESLAFDPSSLLGKNQTLRGFYLPGYKDADQGTRIRVTIETLIQMVGTGDLKLHIDHRFTLSTAALAHRAMDERRTVGKVVLEPWSLSTS
jgi:NADPH2:quinone reductase